MDKHRHDCEVRHVFNMRNMSKMKSYLDLVEKARGKTSADRLREDVRNMINSKRGGREAI